MKIYKYSNKEEFETIKCLLDLRKLTYYSFRYLLYTYIEKYEIDMDQLNSDQHTKLYYDCLHEYRKYLKDCYLLVYAGDLDDMPLSTYTEIYSLNINVEYVNNDLPF